jgi:ketopantoate reductase
MQKKKPAVSTQLKTALAQIEAMKADLAALTKDRDDQKKTKESYYSMRSELEKEVEQVHILLDILPGAAPRKGETTGWNTPTYNLMTRLAAYLANRGGAAPSVN